MKLTDKRFWTAWLVLLLMAIVSCMPEGWSEDSALLGATYALSLLSTWLCHKVRPRTAFVNLIVMIAYNAILSYNLVFNSQYGTGLTWVFFALLLNTIHSIVWNKQSEQKQRKRRYKDVFFVFAPLFAPSIYNKLIYSVSCGGRGS